MDAFAESRVPAVYSMHPRTKKRLHQNKLYAQIMESKNVQVLPPVGYLGFLVLMRSSELIITDSGGIQEEVTAPCIRNSVLIIWLLTERPEAVEVGFVKVVRTEKHERLTTIKAILESRKQLPEAALFGDGNAAEKTTQIVKNSF